ncbi:MAG: hypothetical protein KAX20_03695 [Candidatus Omnitrophica bacterium]|nr:hypothetical protein [Candidatus Omnitrophota bacterium]
MVRVIFGIVLLIGGFFLSTKPKISYKQREGLSDLWAILGLVLLVSGLVLLAMPLLQK